MVRGKKVITTNPDTSLPCPDDKVNRQFKADRPNKLWGAPLCAMGSGTMASDFPYVPTWSGVRHWARTHGACNGSLYVAPRHGLSDQWRFHGSIIDVFARRIVALRDLHANPFRVTAWRASTSMKTRFVPDALDQAIWQRKTPDTKSLVHHSDRGSQDLSIKYTERLAEAEIDLSVGTVGDAYDRASGRHWFKTTGEGTGRMCHPFRGLRGPTGATVPSICSKPKSSTRSAPPINAWKSMRELDRKPSNGSTGITTPRRFTRTCGVHLLDLLGPIGYIPPAQAEEACLMQT